MSERWFPDAMPSPAADALTRPFFDHCRDHRLTVQRCAACGAFRHPPRAICPVCHATEAAWHEVSGRGSVFTFTVVHQALHPALRDQVPYVVVVVSLEGAEGVLLASNLVDSTPGAVAVGAPVEVVWEDMSPELTLPRFRLLAPD